jgi:hypothetical protein
VNKREDENICTFLIKKVGNGKKSEYEGTRVDIGKEDGGYTVDGQDMKGERRISEK